MCTLASLRSDWWTTCPELVDNFIGIRRNRAKQISLAVEGIIEPTDEDRELLQSV
jgi:hypothetical protein